MFFPTLLKCLPSTGCCCLHASREDLDTTGEVVLYLRTYLFRYFILYVFRSGPIDTGVLSLELKRTERETDHPPPSVFGDKKRRSCNSTPSHVLMECIVFRRKDIPNFFLLVTSQYFPLSSYPLFHFSIHIQEVPGLIHGPNIRYHNTDLSRVFSVAPG
jgi:hypothetical protein